MINTIIVGILALTLALFFSWGFRVLPREQWQIMVFVPKMKLQNGLWQCRNLTWYGFFCAFAAVRAAAILIVLLRSIDIPLSVIVMLGSILFLILAPASMIIARLVENKPHTRTIGGAFFAVILSSPWVTLAISKITYAWMGFHLAVMPVLAAFTIAYAFGEGLGRVACISFGCCYGSPLDDSHPLLKRLFHRFHFVFSGATKKISYEGNLEGVKVIPIQAVTSIIFSFAGLAGLFLFLNSLYTTAFITTLVITQLWRAASEFLRTDYRGDHSISAYQKMALLAVVYGICIMMYFGSPDGTKIPDIIAGIHSLWHPGIILFLELLWVVAFLFTGRSDVTGSEASVFVLKDKI